MKGSVCSWVDISNADCSFGVVDLSLYVESDGAEGRYSKLASKIGNLYVNCNVECCW